MSRFYLENWKPSSEERRKAVDRMRRMMNAFKKGLMTDEEVAQSYD